jgi:hypothetical protein
MPRDVLRLARTELAIEQVGQPGRDVQERLLPRRLVVSSGGFEQMARREVLVKERKVLEAQLGHIDLDEGIEITVLLLRGRNAVDNPVHRRLKRRVGMNGERPRGAFYPLVNVRVCPEWPAELPGCLAGGDVEVAETAGRLDLLQDMTECSRAIHFETRRPE